MPKNIVIIGGGISGLATLHYLKLKYSHDKDIQIYLYEANASVGGTISSIHDSGFLFETGPQGFLDSAPQTLRFIKELNLENSLIKASSEANRRYIFYKNHLCALPSSLPQFITSLILSPSQKLRIFKEYIVPKGNNPRESVFDFGQRRFGRAFAENFLDPMVSGIYGGNAKELILKETFPRIAQLENQHGSLIKALFKIKKNKGEGIGGPKGALTSFDEGMDKVVTTLYERHKNNILLNEPVKNIHHENGLYQIKTQSTQLYAQHVFLSLPAYAASHVLQSLDSSFAQILSDIDYSSIIVVGLGYDKSAFAHFPSGFGYLIPSKENKKVLGVLFENNIFPNRAPENEVLLRVMIGGAHHPDIIHLSKDELIEIASREIEQTLNINAKPKKIFFTSFPKAIPQYNHNYIFIKKTIEEKLKQWKNLHIVSNYFNGVSFNDCIDNAYKTVQSI